MATSISISDLLTKNNQRGEAERVCTCLSDKVSRIIIIILFTLHIGSHTLQC